MLKPRERSVLFALFCSFTIACVTFEGYLVYAMIAQGFTGGKAVLGVLNGTILFAIGSKFVSLLTKTFLGPDDIISFSKLHRFASDRCRTLGESEQTNLDDFASRQRLITQSLAFAEESLRGWLPGTHFELCIFLDSQQPLLFAYFDSNRSSIARSMKDREHNPNWYVERQYEVVKILGNPTSHPLIIKDTERGTAAYSFVSTQQRKQLKSTMLWCFDVDTPCAIVVSSNVRDAFQESNPEVESFIKFVGSLALFDLLDKRFVQRLRDLRPNLFPRAVTGNSFSVPN